MIIHFWKSAKTLGFSSMEGGGDRKKLKDLRYDADRILLFWLIGSPEDLTLYMFYSTGFYSWPDVTFLLLFPFTKFFKYFTEVEETRCPGPELNVGVKSQCHKAFDFCFSKHQFPPGPVKIYY